MLHSFIERGGSGGDIAQLRLASARQAAKVISRLQGAKVRCAHLRQDFAGRCGDSGHVAAQAAAGPSDWRLVDQGFPLPPRPPPCPGAPQIICRRISLRPLTFEVTRQWKQHPREAHEAEQELARLAGRGLALPLLNGRR